MRNEISEADAAWLRRPENLDPFYDALVDMLSSFEMQLTKQKITSMEKRQELLAEGKHDEWVQFHLGTLRWKRSIQRLRRFTENKIREVRALRRGRVPEAQLQPVMDVAARLIRAIHVHHEVYQRDGNDDDLEIADAALWALLDDPEVQEVAVLIDQVPVTTV